MKTLEINFVFGFVIGMTSLAFADVVTFNQFSDWGNSDEYTFEWSYNCEIGMYEASFQFDISSLCTVDIKDATFTNRMMTYFDTERSLWNDDQVISTIFQTSDIDFEDVTFNINVTQIDWETDILTLKVTGPVDGSHVCGKANLMESGSLATLTVTTPEPSSVFLLVLGVLGCAGTGIFSRKNRTLIVS